jgi:membrane fusion protein (multidrug efflux system)
MNEKDLMSFLANLPGKNQAEKIKNIPPVTLILADGSEYDQKGKIETISGVVSATTGSTNFRAEFANKEGLLRSGTSGKVQIGRKLDNVFVIPQKATFVQLNKTALYKVQGDSVVLAMIEVTPLPDGQRYAVTAGLNEGDVIVTDGLSTLKEGSKIKVKK